MQNKNLGLIFEAFSLHNGIVQLGVGVAQLFVAAEHFKSLCQTGHCSVATIEYIIY